ncbi:MAG TPA: class I adenylate-forming enzyme family protein, partial [Xanthobacteraceae bacterium]|nr:class I adenylate-forming enzyme family protein [Xanthobacteraceae bacterium]
MHIGAKWRELAQRRGDHVAIVDDHGRWSYRDLHARIARLGNALAGLGLSKGDRVALLVPDIREYLEADYATMSAGFVRVPLDPRLTGMELTALLRYAGAAALITHVSFAPTVAGLTGEIESLRHIIWIGGNRSGDSPGHDYEALLRRASEQPPSPGDGGDLATLNFTGGTTGAPKAAMLQHRNLMAVAHNTINGFGISGDSVFLNVRPLWPIAQVILMSHLFAGATVVLRRFDPENFALLVQQSGATRTSLVPTQ